LLIEEIIILKNFCSFVYQDSNIIFEININKKYADAIIFAAFSTIPITQ